MAALDVEVQWELDGRLVWWAAHMVRQPSGDAYVDYEARDGLPAERAHVHVVSARQLLDVGTQSLLRWRRARCPPSFTAVDVQQLEATGAVTASTGAARTAGDEGDEAAALHDAQQLLAQMPAAHRRRLQHGMARFQAAMATYLAHLPPGHVVTPADIADAAAQLDTTET